jgi:hypothetical protein
MIGTLARGLVLLAAALAPAGLGAQTTTTFEYVYPYNTPDLVENHIIVLETVGGVTRGWYYGTSDEFDTAREGYLPGFFVAPMLDLRLGATDISFTLRRPVRFFTAPVPLEYRDAARVPAGRLEEWSVALTRESVDYAGRHTPAEIALTLAGGARLFRQR